MCVWRSLRGRRRAAPRRVANQLPRRTYSSNEKTPAVPEPGLAGHGGNEPLVGFVGVGQMTRLLIVPVGLGLLADPLGSILGPHCLGVPAEERRTFGN
jgi:hypothetical protein